MAVRKVSVAVEPDVAEAAASAADAQGQSLSAWLNDAARHRLVVERGRRSVADWQAEHTELTLEERALAEALLDELLDAARRGPVRSSTTPARSSPRSATCGRCGRCTTPPSDVTSRHWFRQACSPRRGGPQANLSRLLTGCTIAPMDATLARSVGTLCGQAGTSDVVDASVVVLARLVSAPVVTGDAADLRALAHAAGWRITLHQL